MVERRTNRAARPGPAQQGRAERTVLVVDDDPGALLLLRTVFEEHGWRVIQAANGREALAAHSRHGGVDLIVSDLDMPVMSGLEMCRSLEGGGAKTRVLIVSGMELDPDEVDDVASSAAGFFRKPFRPTDLMETALGLVPS